MHILPDNVVENLEHNRHAKLYIIYSSAFSFMCFAVEFVYWNCLQNPVIGGYWACCRIHMVIGAILSGCCDHMGQHMELFPLFSPGLFRHVSWALIMHFSA